MARSTRCRSACPVVFSLDLFGDRWTLLIVRDLVFRRFTTYGEFLESGEAISTNILADRLRRLEAEGVVTRHPDPEHGARFRYELTRKGLDLVPVLLEMVRYGAKHDPETPVPRSYRRRLDREPRKVADEVVRQMKTGRKT